MSALRTAAVLGFSAALAGGAAYLIWSYASSSGQKKPETRPEEDGGSTKEEERIKTETREGKVEEEEAVVAASATNTAESRSAAGTQVLVLGLDGAGKTSLLHCLATGSLELDMEPTQGFNAVSINREDQHIEFLEIGGREELRPYWQRYMSKALLLVFVVDSSKPEHFTLAKKHLHQLLVSDPGLPVMVLAHKQDLPGACSITDLHEGLALSEAGNRKLFLIGTYVKKGDAELSSGVQDARDLITQMVCDGR